MASPRTFLPGEVQTGENVLNGNRAAVGPPLRQRDPVGTVTSGSEPDDVTVSVNSNESGAPQDTAFLERGWLAGMGVAAGVAGHEHRRSHARGQRRLGTQLS
jgi:hypothetical protein